MFLFDEPFGAVDEITREHLNDETLRLFQPEGFAGLFITHSISEAVFLSTRVLVMSARPGRIVAEFDVPFAYPRDPELRFDADVRRAQRRGLAGPARGARDDRVDRERPAPPAEATASSADPVAATTATALESPSAAPRALRPSCCRRSCSARSFIGVWYFISYVVLDERRRFLLRPPHQVVETASSTGTTFSDDPRWRCGRAPRSPLIGLAISIVLGIVDRRADEPGRSWSSGPIFPYMVVLQAIPILALVAADRVLVRLPARRRG